MLKSISRCRYLPPCWLIQSKRETARIGKHFIEQILMQRIRSQGVGSLDSLIHVLRAPIAHGIKHWIERLAFRREGVFGLRRYNGVDHTLYEAVLLKLAKLLSQHLVGRLRDAARCISACSP